MLRAIVFVRVLLLPFVAAVAILVAGCGSPAPFAQYSGASMGTYYRVTAACPGDVGTLVAAELVEVNAEMSTYQADSVLSRFNSAPVDTWVAVTPSLVTVIDAARALSESSAGAFDVTVGPLVNLWGFGPETGQVVPDQAAIDEARSRVGYEALETRADPPALRKSKPLYVDLSAIAKGHGVDRVGKVLVDAGCTSYLVDIGGEVLAVGVNPNGQAWRIGIEVPDPASVGGIQRVVLLDAAALATSGDYRNFREIDGRRFSHTIDPRTGEPINHGLASVTVLQDSTMWADGYATLLDVLGPEAGWDFAVAHELPALFIVREASGFVERYTPAFEKVLAD